MLRLYLFFKLFHLILSSSDIIIQPIKQGPYNIAIIFIHGFGLPPERYVPLFKQVQSTSSDSVWICMPSFSNDIPLPQFRPNVINETLAKLSTAGMPINTKIFISGHSQGGITSQDLAINYQNTISGQILISSFLQYQYQLAQATYPVSTLTLSGELDGLTSVTRIIESFYFYSRYPHFTLIIPGMNHMDPASDISTSHVLQNDIPSEINQTIAHQELAIRICDYINMRLNNQTTTSMLEYNLYQTKMFSEPYLRALSLEGCYHILPPCYNKTESNCQSGSPWSVYAQKVMSGLSNNIQLNISDEFDIFDEQSGYYPRLDNKCTSEQGSDKCILYIHTITENIYDVQGIQSAAREMRVKMISRQTILHAADGKQYDFNRTDGKSICGLINQQALKWALKNAGKKTKHRYEKLGKKMIIGEDIDPFNQESTWIQTPLKYNITTNNKGERITIVSSPTFRTPKPHDSEKVGFHYCKLLSPTRALEWIYTDSLKS